MRKPVLFKFAIAASILLSGIAKSQCFNTSQYGSATVISNSPGASYTIDACNYAGDYADVNFNVTGAFTFNTNFPGDYVTITDPSNNVLSSGLCPLSVTIPSVGLYYAHFNTSGPPNCGTDSYCHTTMVYATLPPCTGVPSTGTVPPSFSVCPNTAALISASGTPLVSGLIYQWMQSPNGVNSWTNVTGGSGGNTSAYTTPSLTTLTYYQFVATCGASAQSATSAVVSVNPNLPANLCYCTAVGGSCASEVINNVSILGTTFNNNSGCNGTPGNDNLTSFPPSATTTATLTASGIYSISVKATDDCQEALWVDYDHSGTFDASEFTQISLTSTPGVPSVATFTVPLTALSGLTGMRVRSTGSGASLGSGPGAACTSVFFGETEDYLITIQPALACSGAPNAGTTIATSTMVCTGNTVNITVTGNSVATGLTYQWQSSPNGTSWTSIPLATSIATNQTISSTTYYRCVFSCSTNTAASVPVQINVAGAPVYATVPFLETFDNTWQNRCDNRNVPVTNNWSSAPTTGFNSWRRQDDGATAGWTSSSGLVTPIGAGCANFHTYDAGNGSIGNLLLYVNLSGTSSYSMSFDYYNDSGDDSLEVFLSSNAGASFSKKGGYIAIGPSWGTYSITLGAVNSNSCILRFKATSDYGNDDLAIDNLKIYNCIAPSITASSSSSIICTGSSATLTASGAATYTWSNGSSAASTVVSPTVNTTYTVTGSNAGCSGIKTVSVAVSPCTKVNSIAAFASEVLLYPNPTNNVLNISIPEIKNDLLLEIYDGIGKLIISKPLNEKQTSISTEQLAQGIYIYRIKTDTEVVKQGKLIRE